MDFFVHISNFFIYNHCKFNKNWRFFFSRTPIKQPRSVPPVVLARRITRQRPVHDVPPRPTHLPLRLLHQRRSIRSPRQRPQKTHHPVVIARLMLEIAPRERLLHVPALVRRQHPVHRLLRAQSLHHLAARAVQGFIDALAFDDARNSNERSNI